jgi:uncharacterized membrane protein
MSAPDSGLEAVVGRLLTWATYASVVVLALGVVLMLAAGRSPLEVTSPLDLAALPGGVVALRPEALLWVGLLAVIFTPAARVLAALAGFAVRGERQMAVVAALVLVVIVLGVLLARPLEA